MPKVSSYDETTALDDDDLLYAVVDGESRKATVATVKADFFDSPDIDGGTIDGAVIGGTTPAAGTFTTFTSTGIDDNATSTAITIDAGEQVGIGTVSPQSFLHVNRGSNGKIIQANGVSAAFKFALEATNDQATNSFLYTLGMEYNGNPNTVLKFGRGNAGQNGFFAIDQNGSEAMRIDSSGNVGIGTSSPDSKLEIDNGDFKVQGASLGSYFLIKHDYAVNSVGFDLIRSDGTTSFSHNGHSGSTFIKGDLEITGALSKGSGSFKIDHPIKPETHHLVHSFVEGPQADNLYRGKVVLVDGQATVNLDEAGRMTEGTFVALNGNVQCCTTNEDGWTQVRGKVLGNILTIEAQDPACTDEVSWLVIGERRDQHIIETDWTDENGRVITEPAKKADLEGEA